MALWCTINTATIRTCLAAARPLIYPRGRFRPEPCSGSNWSTREFFQDKEDLHLFEEEISSRSHSMR